MRSNNKNELGVFQFSRRVFLVFTAKILFITILVIRLIYLQIFKLEYFEIKSEKNIIRNRIIPAKRGLIRDRFGAILADSTKYYRIYLHKSNNIDDYKKIIDILAETLPEREINKQNLLQNLIKQKDTANILLLDQLSWNEMVKIEERSFELIQIDVVEYYVRQYNYNYQTCHILGYLGTIEKKNLDKNSEESQYHLKIGKYGIERLFEKDLQGKSSSIRIMVDAYGNVVNKLDQKFGTTGQDLDLSIDMVCQQAAYDALGGAPGTVVLLDIYTGEVLTLLSSPSFDANKLNLGITQKYWDELLEDPYLPLVDKSISVNYPPGSPFKLMVVLAALQSHIKAHEKVFCPGYLQIGNRIMHCWNKTGHGYVDMKEAIAMSCNVYMGTIAQKIGVDSIIKIAGEFGFGEKTGIELPNEASGLIPNKLWKKKKYHSSWTFGDTVNTSIGQGFVLSSNLQLALMSARIATGLKIEPTIIKRKEAKIFERLEYSEEFMNILRDGMFMVINSDRGTGSQFAINDLDWQIAGKTGTAQVISKNNINYRQNLSNALYRYQHHGIFTGYIPYHKPRFAISVVVEHAGAASQALSVVKNMMLQLKSRLIDYS